MRVDNGKYPEGEEAVDPQRVKRVKLLSRVAIITCISMYISYIPEIIANFSGHPVSPIQPLVAMINATLWVGYGWFKTYRDWPVIISNVPGIFFGFITVLTVYVH